MLLQDSEDGEIKLTLWGDEIEKVSDGDTVRVRLCPRDITPQSSAGVVPVQAFLEFFGLWYFSHTAGFKCCPKP